MDPGLVKRLLPRRTSLVSAVGVTLPRHSARLDGERRVRASRTGKPIRDGYNSLKTNTLNPFGSLIGVLTQPSTRNRK